MKLQFVIREEKRALPHTGGHFGHVRARKAPFALSRLLNDGLRIPCACAVAFFQKKNGVERSCQTEREGAIFLFGKGIDLISQAEKKILVARCGLMSHQLIDRDLKDLCDLGDECDIGTALRRIP